MDTPIPCPPHDVARSARRLVYLSRGLPLAVYGIWMTCIGGLRLASLAVPAVQPYALVLIIACGVGMVLSQIWIARFQVKEQCSVRAHRQGSTREDVVLFIVITLGVLIVVALSETGLFDQEWIGLAFLSLLLTAGGAYFIYESARLKLVELALLGAHFWVLCLLSLYMDYKPLSDLQFETALQVTLAASGLFATCVGALLHRRWSAWRAQVLQA